MLTLLTLQEHLCNVMWLAAGMNGNLFNILIYRLPRIEQRHLLSRAKQHSCIGRTVTRGSRE